MAVHCYDASSDCIVQSSIIHKWSYKMTINPYFEPSTLYNIRVNLQLSPTEAGQLAGVSRRTWEMWEKGAVTMPSDKVEKLKNKLEAKGYFDGNYKQPLPKYPKKIAIVTSPTGAAIEDMKKVASHRWSLVEFILIPTLVQGEGAAFEIANSIKYADKLHCDIMIVGRGGGSIEDLWAFNEEIVANAIYEAKTPIISAVGHEVDYLISDFVADIRAATPSNAIEIALPDINEHRIYLDSLINEYNNRMKNILFNKQQEVLNMKRLFEQNSIETKFNYIQTEINLLKSSFKTRSS